MDSRLLIAVLLIASARGQSLPGLGPRLPEAPAAESLPKVRAGDAREGGEILVPTLHSIRLLSEGGGEVQSISPGLTASSSLDVPARRKLGSRLLRWLGKPLTSGGLAGLADEILIHLDQEGFPVVLLEVPEQDFAGGVLTLNIQIGRLGNVGVSRSKHADEATLQKGLMLSTGDPVRRDQLDMQLAWYGRNVFRRPRLFVSPGEAPATADVLIAFEETRPWRVTAGYENSGPDLLGRDRLLLGVAGITPGEHLVAWQSVVGMPASSLVANAVRWEIPFPASHQLLQLDAAYAEVLSRYVTSGIPVESEGSSWSLGALQKIPLSNLGGWKQTLGVGFELKGTDQFLLYGGGSLSPGEVVLFHGKVTHEISRTWDSGSIAIESMALAAPAELGGNNEDSAFKGYDREADASYFIGRMTGDAWWSPGADWQFHLRGGLQVADSRLLPVEQFSAGGYQTVRGVSEREFSSDCGWQGSFAVLSPAISPLSGTGFRLLGFFDYAGLTNRGGDSSSVSGAGFGLRLKVTEHVDLRLDHGWRLDETENRSHFGISFNF